MHNCRWRNIIARCLDFQTLPDKIPEGFAQSTVRKRMLHIRLKAQAAHIQGKHKNIDMSTYFG